MKTKTVKRLGTMIGCLLATLVYLVVLTFSWLVTCGIIKLITLCFGWTFSWAWATGIWLALYLLKSMFSHSTTRK